MIDDHDRCEWVNVSSCTNSLGQNLESRKTVVVVVVAVVVIVVVCIVC